MAAQYTNLRVILNRLLRNPLLSDLTLELVIDYTIDFVQIVGLINNFQEKVVKLEVKNFRTLLPLDYYEVNQIRDKLGYMRASTSTFHLSDKNDSSDKEFSTLEHTFFMQNNYIYFNFESGDIELSYQSIATDNEGLPLLPDNTNFLRALESYIKKIRFDILYDLGKISDRVMNKAEQDYAWAVGSLETDVQRLNLSKAQSLFNQYSSLLPHSNDFNNGFNLIGSR